VGVGDDFDHGGLIALRQGGGAGFGRGSTPDRDASLPVSQGAPLPLPDVFGKVRRFSSSSWPVIVVPLNTRSGAMARGRGVTGETRECSCAIFTERAAAPDMARPSVQQRAAPLLTFLLTVSCSCPMRENSATRKARTFAPLGRLLVSERLQPGASPQAEP